MIRSWFLALQSPEWDTAMVMLGVKVTNSRLQRRPKVSQLSYWVCKGCVFTLCRRKVQLRIRLGLSNAELSVTAFRTVGCTWCPREASQTVEKPPKDLQSVMPSSCLVAHPWNQFMAALGLPAGQGEVGSKWPQNPSSGLNQSGT